MSEICEMVSDIEPPLGTRAGRGWGASLPADAMVRRDRRCHPRTHLPLPQASPGSVSSGRESEHGKVGLRTRLLTEANTKRTS